MNAAHKKQTAHAKTLKTGDKVAFSAMWLRSTQASGRAKMRGVITQIGGVFPKGYTNSDGEDLSDETLSEAFCLVSWDGQTPRMVALFNLARVGSLAFAEAPHMGK